jgi:CysZ protein
MARTPSSLRNFLSGIRLLGSGLGMWLTSPRLMLLGAIPALIVGVTYAGLVVLVVANYDPIVTWATPFAADWDATARSLLRIAAGLAIVGLLVFLLVATFSALTLAVGDPFYERIWRQVEHKLGNPPPDVKEGVSAAISRGIGNGLRLGLSTALVGVCLFLGGFIPLVGQTVIPVLGALFGGWFLALGLSGFAFDARHLDFSQRRKLLGASRAKTLGFGVVTYLLFLIPFAAIFVMPAAVAGATMLSREALQPLSAPPTTHRR